MMWQANHERLVTKVIRFGLGGPTRELRKYLVRAQIPGEQFSYGELERYIGAESVLTIKHEKELCLWCVQQVRL